MNKNKQINMVNKIISFGSNYWNKGSYKTGGPRIKIKKTARS